MMAAAYPDIYLYAYVTAGWVDITADFLGTNDARGDVRQGMSDNRPLTRIARTGEFVFYLNNTTGRYSPGHAGALTGWKTGIPVKLVMSYDGRSYLSLWHIASPDGIEIDPGIYGPRRARVTCLDWFDYADKWPVVNPGVLTNKRGGEIMTQILALMDKQPANTGFDTTVNLFPTVFGTVTSRTTALKEAVKVNTSEGGYFYIHCDDVYGESLVLESATHRSGLDAETPVFLAAPDGTALTDENDVALTDENDVPLVDDEMAVTSLTSIITDADIVHGKNVINYLTAWAYPARLDASPVVLWQLNEPTAIAPGQTVTIKGSYINPTGGLPCNGQSMITPVATTDYLFYENSDGTGTNLTANIVLDSVVYGTEGFTHHVRNGGTTTGYLTSYAPRGTGIYYESPTQRTASDSDSIAERGAITETLHAKYQKTTNWINALIDTWLEQEKHPGTRVNSVNFCANDSPAAMQAFLNLHIGDVVRVTESQTALDTFAYIQGRNYTFLPGGIIMNTWILKGFLNLILGLSLVGVEINTGSVSQASAIDYGVIEYLQNMPRRTFVISAYPTDLSGTLDTLVVLGGGGGKGLLQVYLDNSPAQGTIYIDWRQSGSVASWHSTTGTLYANFWYRIVVSFDNSVGTPVLYVDGVKQTLAVDTAPSGTVLADVDSRLTFGAVIAQTGVYSEYFEGRLANALIYSDILSDAEVAAMPANPLDPPTLTDSLIFQGFAAPTEHLADYIGTLGANDKPWDNVYGRVGLPVGSPKPSGFHIPRNPTAVTAGGTSSGSAANAATLTISHTVTAGNNKFLHVLISKRAFNDTTSVIWGTTALSLSSTASYAAGNYPEYEIWNVALGDVATNTNANVVITLPSNDWFEVAVIDTANTNQLSPYQSVVSLTGTGANPALTINSKSTDLVLNLLAIEKGAATITVNGGQTQIMNLSSDGNWAGAASTEPGANYIVSSGWTVSSSPHNWIFVNISIQGVEQ